MPSALNLLGRRFGRLIVTARSPVINTGKTVWFCQCDCGGSKVVAGSSLMKGATQSCGCIHKEMLIKRNTTHGKSRDPLYTHWWAMMRRCYDKNTIYYHNYGGRGIYVTKRWHKFENFYKDMNTCYSPGLTLDRKNNNLGYSKANCKWSNVKQQGRNKRNNRIINVSGQAMTVSEWEELFNCSKSRRIYGRIRRGWDPVAAVLCEIK